MEKTSLTQYGFQSATNSQSNPESIEGYLDHVYDKFLEEQKLDEQGIKNRVSKLREEVLQIKIKKNEIQSEIATELSNKKELENEIQEIELEKIDIKNGDAEFGDTTSFVIGAFIVILLTLYLFVFYSSAGFSALYGIKPGSLGFINANVFADSLVRGSGAFAFVILLPIVFLGLGYLIHVSIEKNKKLEIEDKPKNYSLISTLLIITFIMDAFIGYKISEGVHGNEFSAGLKDDIWNFKMVFYDINFYLILFLGFIVYVIWGILLNNVLSHPYLKTESEKTKILIENINARILEKRNELKTIISKIVKAEGDIVICNTKLEDKERDVIGYENGDIPINIPALKGDIGEFIAGWQYFTNGNFNSNEALSLNNEAIKVQSNWLNKKVENLKTEK
jgi:hypothetical protein